MTDNEYPLLITVLCQLRI